MSDRDTYRPRGAAKAVPPGAVTVERIDGQWWAVRIGRARNVKTFNLTRSEAAVLAEALVTHVLTGPDRPDWYRPGDPR